MLVTTKERGISLLLSRPDAHQIDLTKRRVSGRAPADKLVESAEAISNEIGMPVIVLAVVEGNTHHLACGHFCNRATRGQMMTKRTLWNHNVHRRLGKRPCWTRDA